MAAESTARIKVKLVRSTNGKLKKHKACVRGLGLRKINDERILENTPAVRGMIRKVAYMVQSEKVT